MMSRSTLRQQGHPAMNEVNETTALPLPRSEAVSDLLTQYGRGPIRFSGHNDALYERHLLFDDVVDPLAARPRAF
jgi:glycogen phosphorylase